MQNLVLGQPSVLIVDQAKLERKAFEIVSPLSGATSSVLHRLPTRPSGDALPSLNEYVQPDEFLGTLDDSSNVLIIVSEFVQIYSLKCLFQLVHTLQTFAKIKQVWLWASPATIGKDMVVPYLEHMASVNVVLGDETNLSVLVKNTSKGTTSKMFSYKIKDYRFELTEIQKAANVKEAEPTIDPESLTTFKINFDEEELQARNTLKLPYERTSDEKSTESKIIYHPDADDDFDEEDPDEDLNI